MSYIYIYIYMTYSKNMQWIEKLIAYSNYGRNVNNYVDDIKLSLSQYIT